MPTPKKEQTVAELKEAFGRAALTIVTDYRGLSVPQLQQLRAQLRESQAEMRVAKNTLTKIAADAQEINGLDSVLEGPTALVFAYDDPAQPAKILRDFARSSRILQIKAGVLEGNVLTADQVADIADLPSREELVAKVVGGISSPLYGLVGVLSGPVRSLAYVLQARREQLEQAA
ncbi:MAG TPA: 50S ribosomal protein L10 [Thermomicrobiales bacterium]|nr:50S ribosomal protein L10 [Thermomicrobiales bacterium]